MTDTAKEIIAKGDVDDSPIPTQDTSNPGLPKPAGTVDPNVDPAVAEAAAKKATEDAAKTAEAEAKAAENAKKAAEEVPTEYPTFENEYAQSAVDIMKEAKVSVADANEIFKDAIAENDLSKADWSRLETLVGRQRALLIKTGIEAYHGTEYQDSLATKNYGFEKAGNEANWNKVAEWHKAKAASDPAHAKVLDGIRKGVRANGELAKMSVDKAIELYHADPKNSSLTFTMVNGTTKPQAMGKPLTRADYVAELETANGTLRGAALAEATAALDARRREGMRQRI